MAQQIKYSNNQQEGGEEMPEMTRTGQKIVNAELGQKTEYVRILDWKGKSLTFILVNEIRPEERSAYLGPGEDRREPTS